VTSFQINLQYPSPFNQVAGDRVGSQSTVEATV
jgi:hypothetical protein